MITFRNKDNISNVDLEGEDTHFKPKACIGRKENPPRPSQKC